MPQLYSMWKFTLRLSQLSRVAVDLFRSSQTQSKSAPEAERGQGWAKALREPTPSQSTHGHLFLRLVRGFSVMFFVCLFFYLIRG